jgi:hypothetical protein
MRFCRFSPRRKNGSGTSCSGFLNFLTGDPFVESDSVQPDSVGRPCRVKRFCPWTVTFWPEHLANEIHIVDVDRLA